MISFFFTQHVANNKNLRQSEEEVKQFYYIIPQNIIIISTNG